MIPGARKRDAWLAAFLACATVVVYFPSLHNGFVWDDDAMVTANAFLRSWSGLGKYWFTAQVPDYWPVTSTVFWIEWHLWGMRAAGYHAVSLGLHIVEALLLWSLLRRLRIPGAYLAAFLFAVHPVNVESVAWVSEMKNLVAMLFFLLSTLAYVKYEEFLQEDREGREERHSGETHLPGLTTATLAASRSSRPSCKKYYGAALVLFVLAMLSKGSVAIEPLVILGIVMWRRPLQVSDVLRVLPFFAVSGVLVLVDMWFEHHGVAVAIRSAGPLERLLGAGAVAWFYLGKALWPAPLVFVYRQWDIRPASFLWWLPLVAALGAMAALWRARGTGFRAARYGLGFFCLALLPVLGFTDVYFMKYSLVADRYEHIALIGVVTLAAFAWSAWSARSGGTRLPVAAAAAVLAGLGVLTWRHSRIFRNSETLYRSILGRNPDAWIAHTNLGMYLASEGRVPEAMAHYREAIRLKPDIPEPDIDMGIALAAAGRTDEGIAWLRKALALRPDSVEAHYNLGLAFVTERRYPEAISQFEKVEKLHPDFDLTEFNLGGACLATGKPAAAAAHYEKAVASEPDFAEAYYNLGAALVQAGNLSAAADAIANASRLSPEDAGIHNDLGCTYAELGRRAEARAEFEKALRLKPDYAEAKANLDRLAALPPP